MISLEYTVDELKCLVDNRQVFYDNCGGKEAFDHYAKVYADDPLANSPQSLFPFQNNLKVQHKYNALCILENKMLECSEHIIFNNCNLEAQKMFKIELSQSNKLINLQELRRYFQGCRGLVNTIARIEKENPRHPTGKGGQRRNTASKDSGVSLLSITISSFLLHIVGAY